MTQIEQVCTWKRLSATPTSETLGRITVSGDVLAFPSAFLSAIFKIKDQCYFAVITYFLLLTSLLRQMVYALGRWMLALYVTAPIWQRHRAARRIGSPLFAVRRRWIGCSLFALVSQGALPKFAALCVLLLTYLPVPARLTDDSGNLTVWRKLHFLLVFKITIRYVWYKIGTGQTGIFVQHFTPINRK